EQAHDVPHAFLDEAYVGFVQQAALARLHEDRRNTSIGANEREPLSVAIHVRGQPVQHQVGRMKSLGCAPGCLADRGPPILRVGSRKWEQSLDDLAAMHVEDATGSAGYIAPP